MNFPLKKAIFPGFRGFFFRDGKVGASDEQSSWILKQVICFPLNYFTQTSDTKYTY